jgi:inhibitor of KinA sporulation pathway (predicted exonuclease)
MGVKLDLINVIDVEATCWEGTKPENQESEIIEIGICTLDVATGNRVDRSGILVKPECSTVSQFCTELTTLTPAKLAGGIAFKQACQILRKKYLSRDRVWASYGQYDLNQFKRQCESFRVAYPFNQRHINVKILFALIYELPQEVSMDRALEILNIPLEGTHHRGIDDANNIAKILSKLIKNN